MRSEDKFHAWKHRRKQGMFVYVLRLFLLVFCPTLIGAFLGLFFYAEPSFIHVFFLDLPLYLLTLFFVVMTYSVLVWYVKEARFKRRLRQRIAPSCNL
ncbi:hypothetical protein BCT23_13880 [Enterovibrio norvegicus]|uniref:Uncharacterized protein n=1 Tax=Enterovibrio norvegicus TaxID=188144 RepID=A0A2N7LBE4_9GAMM|nr:hypothetical protein BCT69_10910 [Enterovibrio norvegicus]PMN92569.1 hypothetical protein BCT23_13880 [Enterovibrio norvegicus]